MNYNQFSADYHVWHGDKDGGLLSIAIPLLITFHEKMDANFASHQAKICISRFTENKTFLNFFRLNPLSVI
jgi:hypothetical protein